MNIAIYQINPDRDENNVVFLNYENLERFQGPAALRSEIYGKVFEGEVECGTLEEVYQMFNLDHPDGYRGRSLSVSDVVEVVGEEKSTFHFCDSIGFREVDFDPDMTEPLKEKKIKVVLCEPGKVARVAEIGTEFSDLQRVVGGLIEPYYPFEEQVCIVCNDEGKYNGMRPCRAIYGEGREMMDIIFGPLHQQHIKPLADFADKHDIRLVIPFTSKDNTVFRNPSVYQINTPQSYLYSEVYDHFVRQFPNANVIFIEASQGTREKADFIKGLKEELRNRSIPTKSLKEDATVEFLKAVLRADRENIFIPTSGSNITLIKILPQLTLLVRETPDSRIHLFGYPEWQTYTKDHLEAFFELDTYFYSSFYTNNLLPAAINFTKSYRKWYGKEMDERYPKFGMLGFDTGYFFLKGLSRYGSGFEKNLDKMDLVPIQTGFKFQRVNNWGGFINRKVFFVRFTKNFELIKLDFD